MRIVHHVRFLFFMTVFLGTKMGHEDQDQKNLLDLYLINHQQLKYVYFSGVLAWQTNWHLAKDISSSTEAG